MAEDVLVIGAGPAGIASAYYLERAGISYRVVDQAAEIASTWANLYPSLRLNTTRFFSHLPGRRFPLHFGILPLGRQYYEYLVRYASDHQFNIHLGVTVHRITPEGGLWRVESSEGISWYPAVISASGRFASPYVPAIPGMDRFAGTLIHAKAYLGPQPFVNRRVMVVGNGPSGIDIAVELGNFATAPVLLAQRTGITLRPRYPYGLHKHMWMMIADFLPGRIGQRLLDWIDAVKYPERALAGIKTPPPGEESSAAGGIRGRDLIDAVRDGKVRCVDAPVQFFERGVAVETGGRYEVDAVIMGTGYRPALYTYFDFKGETDDQDWPRRLDDLKEGGQREVAGYPGLYLVGVFYKGKGAMYNINVEAATAVQEIQQRLAALKDMRDAPIKLTSGH